MYTHLSQAVEEKKLNLRPLKKFSLSVKLQQNEDEYIHPVTHISARRQHNQNDPKRS